MAFGCRVSIPDHQTSPPPGLLAAWLEAAPHPLVVRIQTLSQVQEVFNNLGASHQSHSMANGVQHVEEEE